MLKAAKKYLFAEEKQSTNDDMQVMANLTGVKRLLHFEVSLLGCYLHPLATLRHQLEGGVIRR